MNQAVECAGCARLLLEVSQTRAAERRRCAERLLQLRVQPTASGIDVIHNHTLEQAVRALLEPKFAAGEA
jgi:hypothetical protein